MLNVGPFFCENNFYRLGIVSSKNENDKVIWKVFPNGTFSLKSTYNIVCNLEMVPKMRLFKLVHC